MVLPTKFYDGTVCPIYFEDEEQQKRLKHFTFPHCTATADGFMQVSLAARNNMYK